MQSTPQLFPAKFTHKQLVEIGYKWVLKNGSCGFALKELKSIDDEIPDVLGFGSHESVLIECKTSRGDFFADMKKPHRAKGMGNWRFYLCPKGLIKASELPAKWGLIYVDESGKAKIEHDCRKKKIIEKCEHSWQWAEYPAGSYERTIHADENCHEVDTLAERRIMYSALRRILIKGHLNCIYDKEYNGLGVNEILEQYEEKTA